MATEMISTTTLVTATINGDATAFQCEPRDSLLDVLRDRLLLTGAKEGCNNGNCGACNVIVDGTLVNSCCVLAVETQGAEIRTIEASPSRRDCTRCRRRSWRTRHCSAGCARRGSSCRAWRCWSGTPTPANTRYGYGWRATCAGARATTRSCGPCRTPLSKCERLS